jgi:hypothetical protein
MQKKKRKRKKRNNENENALECGHKYKKARFKL